MVDAVVMQECQKCNVVINETVARKQSVPETKKQEKM